MTVPGLCVHDGPHSGRCRDGRGMSWEQDHSDDPEVERWRRLASTACWERDVARRELAQVREAWAVLSVSLAPVMAVMEGDQMSLLDLEHSKEGT